MRRSCKFAATVSLLATLAVSLGAASQPVSLKIIVPAGYLPQVPVLVRVEALDALGGRERSLWDAVVVLSANSGGVTLSTNRVHLRNGESVVIEASKTHRLSPVGEAVVLCISSVKT